MTRHAQFILMAMLLLTAAAARAQDPASVSFVIIVDTSFSMNSKKAATVEAVRDIVRSGFQNQIKEGEPFSIWLFNEKLDARSFPPRIWDPVQREAFGELAARYVNGVKREKRNHFGPVVEELRSRPGTNLVVLLTDGDERIEGTPLDAQINAAFASEGSEVRKAKRPFIISFLLHNFQWSGLAIQGNEPQVQFPEMPRPALRPPPTEEIISEAEVAEVEEPAIEAPKVIDLPPGARIAPAPAAPPPQVEEQIAERPAQLPQEDTPAEAPTGFVPLPNETPQLEELSEPEAREPVAVSEEPPARIVETVQANPSRPPVVPSGEASAVVSERKEPIEAGPAGPQSGKVEKKEENPLVEKAPSAEQTAVSPAAEGAFSVNPLAFIAGTLACAGIVALAVWQRSRKRSRPGSLISQSLRK